MTTFFLCFFVGYCLDMMLKIADELEKDGIRKIEDFDEVTEYTYNHSMKIFSKVMILFYNLSVIIINTVNFSKFLRDQMFSLPLPIFQSLSFYKLLLIIVFLLVLIFLIEPEKLRYVSYLATFILVVALSIMWIYNI